MSSVTTIALALLSFSALVYSTGINDQVNRGFDYGTFENPSSNVRPRFRYWVPDASINLTHLAFDIADAGSRGVGGVEILGYYLYGDYGYGGSNEAPVPTDWTTYGWGTPAWREVQDTALQATKENGLIVDFTLGPDQGAGLPAPVDSDGLLWDLAAFNITITNDGFNDVLPGWGTGPLVSASTGLVIKTVNETITTVQFGTTRTSYAVVNTLQTSSLQDLTDQVQSDGRLAFQVPALNQTGNYTLFAYYLVHSEFREAASPAELTSIVPQSPVTNYVQNGSWVVDHYSARGAQAVIDFWETYLLNGSNTKSLLAEVGNYLWEDSQEFSQGVYIFWTPDFPDTFLANRGYNMRLYLPTFFHENTMLISSIAWFITDEGDGGASHITDYRQTLNELYGIYLQTLVGWANSLGIQFSAQVAYNFPEDMLQDMPIVNGPEVESLGFNHQIDWYRQAAGPAHLAGKRILSSECGANPNDVYQQTIPFLLWDVKRSVAGMINNFILHGMPYSGDYPNTTWPSFTTFVYDFSQMHGRHEPAWEYYSDFLNYTSRLQYISQTGVPKIDVAFYLKEVNFQSLTRRYTPTDLEEAGYTYNYISPDNFELPNSFVLDGVLAPDAQAFKVLIIRGNDSMTVTGAQKINEYARSGMTVIFSGGIPTNISGYATATTTAYVNATLASILSLPNVHQASYEGLAQTLASLGIMPRARISANATWYSLWRTNASSTTDYVFLYNDATDSAFGANSSIGNVTFEAIGVPYYYDAWTGITTPVSVYTQTANTTTIPFQLAGNQTVIIGFQNTTTACPHVNGTSYQYPAVDGSILVSADDPTTTATLSNGSSVTFTPPSESATILGPWNLTIESWMQPTDIYDISTTASKTNSTWSLPTLTPWQAIDASLQNVSGRGYYSTNFTWPQSTNTSAISASGAFLDLGAIIHTARAYINSHALPPLDVTAARADITQYLVPGINKLDIVVSTPLGNALRPLWNHTLLTSDKPPDPSASLPVEADYGLVGLARLVPYAAYAL